MTPDLPPDAAKALPGAVGAIVALRWLPGPPLQRAFAFIGGTGASYYGGEHASSLLSAPAGLTGFLIGLFGMAVAAKVFEAIEQIKVGEIIARFLRRFGL